MRLLLVVGASGWLLGSLHGRCNCCCWRLRFCCCSLAALRRRCHHRCNRRLLLPPFLGIFALYHSRQRRGADLRGVC